MTAPFRRLAARLTAALNPTTEFVDAAFDGGHSDPDSVSGDPAPDSRAGSQLDRLRPQRRDLSSALSADAVTPDQELAAWPPVAAASGGRTGG